MVLKSDSNDIEKKNTGSFLSKSFQIMILLLSVLACVKTIFISLDIDESYAMAVGYRLATGERFFKDLWEAHQLGGFFIAPFLRLFLMITGSTSYMVIYARVLGTVIHLGIGIYLYESLKHHFSKAFCLLLFFIHLNFLPKWVQIPEFEVQQYWFILLEFLFLYRFFMAEHQKRRYLVLSGFMILLQMFSYPTLILLYPFMGIFIWMINQKDGKARKLNFLDLLYFTLGALVPGMLFVAYLCTYMSISDFQKYLSYMFRDESHTLVSTSDKWKIFLADFCQIWKDGIGTIIIAGVITGVCFLFYRRKNVQKRHANTMVNDFGWKDAGYTFLCSIIFLLSLQQIYGCLLGNENQFYMLWRFFMIGFFGLLLYFVKRDRLISVITCFAVIPGFVVLLSVMIMTNMDINTSMAKMFISVIGVFMILACIKENAYFKTALYSVLAGLLICKLILMRVSGCLEVTVMAPLSKIEEGPAAGIYMLEDTATVLKDDYQVFTQLLTKEDNLLYVGSENIVYLWTDAKVATPSTQGTNAYNEMFIRYFEEFPEKMPTVIAVDKELGENPVYYNSPQNHILFDWIDKKYGYTEMLESNYLTLYVKR